VAREPNDRPKVCYLSPESRDESTLPPVPTGLLTAFLEKFKASLLFPVSAALAGLALVLTFACGTAPTPTMETQVDPHAVLSGVVDRLMTMQSAAFTLEDRVGTTVLLPGLEVNRVYGVAVIPDKFRFTVEAEFNGTYVETDVVVVDQQAYMTNFITGKWEEVPLEVLPLNFADLGKTLADIIQAVEAPTLMGTNTIRDHQVYLIRGRVRSEDLTALVPNAQAGFDVELELAVDRTEGLLVQVLIAGWIVATDTEETVRVLSLDDIDVPVDIKAPR